jgi:hypothetical protein
MSFDEVVLDKKMKATHLPWVAFRGVLQIFLLVVSFRF